MVGDDFHPVIMNLRALREAHEANHGKRNITLIKCIQAPQNVSDADRRYVRYINEGEFERTPDWSRSS